MCFICSQIFRNFGGREIRSKGTKVLVVCCCIKNHVKAQWLKTMNIYYHTVSVGQKFGSSLVGGRALGFSGGSYRNVGRSLTWAGRSSFKMAVGRKLPFLTEGASLEAA